MIPFSSTSAQTTVGTGSIIGVVNDPTGAVVGGANITIVNTATNQVIRTNSNSSGAYASGALNLGQFKVQVSAKGFSSLSEMVNVQVANTATCNATLQIGQENQVIEVQAGTEEVNTEQASVREVLSRQQIDDLPVNGRNFLDLAQLEPGVQIQDGTNFDPTKSPSGGLFLASSYARIGWHLASIVSRRLETVLRWDQLLHPRICRSKSKLSCFGWRNATPMSPS